MLVSGMFLLACMFGGGESEAQGDRVSVCEPHTKSTTLSLDYAIVETSAGTPVIRYTIVNHGFSQVRLSRQALPFSGKRNSGHFLVVRNGVPEERTYEHDGGIPIVSDLGSITIPCGGSHQGEVTLESVLGDLKQGTYCIIGVWQPWLDYRQFDEVLAVEVPLRSFILRAP